MGEMLAAANVAYRAFLYANPEIQDKTETYLTFLSGFKAYMEAESEPESHEHNVADIHVVDFSEVQSCAGCGARIVWGETGDYRTYGWLEEPVTEDLTDEELGYRNGYEDGKAVHADQVRRVTALMFQWDVCDITKQSDYHIKMCPSCNAVDLLRIALGIERG